MPSATRLTGTSSPSGPWAASPNSTLTIPSPAVFELVSACAAAGQHQHLRGPGETRVYWLGDRSLLSPALSLVLYSCRHEAGDRVGVGIFRHSSV